MDDNFADYSSYREETFTENSEDEDYNLNNDIHEEEDLNVVQLSTDEELDFSKLPLDLQCAVVNKFEFQEFSRFEQVSRLANDVCCKESHSIPLNVSVIYVHKKSIKICMIYQYDLESVMPRIPYRTVCQSPVRINADTVIISDRLNSGQMQKVVNLFEKNRTTAQELKILADINFKPEDFEQFLKVTSPGYFTCSPFLARGFFQTKGLQKMEYLNLERTGCTDEELVKLNGENFLRMRSDFITARGFNQFLKQWKNKDREIYCVSITLETNNGPLNVDAVLDGLDANPIWTPATHYDSLLGGLPLESIYPMRTGNPEHVYSMWRPENPEERIIIALSQNEFSMNIYQKETFIIYQWLSADEHYILLNECRDCRIQFCEHRRRYSTAQLKKYYPWVHSFFVKGLWALGMVSAGTRLLKYVAGERPFTRVPQYGFLNLLDETGVSRVISALQFYLFDYI